MRIVVVVVVRGDHRPVHVDAVLSWIITVRLQHDLACELTSKAIFSSRITNPTAPYGIGTKECIDRTGA